MICEKFLTKICCEKMDQFQLKKHYVEPVGQYNIVSVCAFKMKLGYKAMKAYVNGLRYLISHLNDYLPNFYLRIYYDRSIESDSEWEDVWLKMATSENVQPVEFCHPWFSDDGIYHAGTFGTLVRLLPLFDSDPKVKVIVISDIDVPAGMFQYWQRVNANFENNKSRVLMFGRFCSYLQERVRKIAELTGLAITPYLNSLWSKERFPKEIMDSFLKCLHVGDLIKDVKCRDVDVFFNEVDRSKIKQSQRMGDEKITYGVDEMFLLRLINHLIENKIPHSYDLMPYTIIPLKVFYDLNPIALETQPHIELIQKIMEEYYNDKASTAENFKQIHDLLFVYKTYLNPTKEEKILTDYFSQNIIKIMKNDHLEKMGFDPDLVNCAANSNTTQLTNVKNDFSK